MKILIIMLGILSIMGAIAAVFLYFSSRQDKRLAKRIPSNATPVGVKDSIEAG